MRREIRSRRAPIAVVALIVAALACAPRGVTAHPLGNFSISHYSAIRVGSEGIGLRYVVDLAEIPTFQEMQDEGIPARARSPRGPRLLEPEGRAPRRGPSPRSRRPAAPAPAGIG